MIQFKSHGEIPKSYIDAKVRCISSRNTLYGIHKNYEKHSKTRVVAFTEKNHVDRFKVYLLELQHKGKVIERCSDFESFMIPYTLSAGSRLPLSVVEYPMIDLMKMCHLNFFDMYVVFDIVNEPYDVITLHFFTYESPSYPHRGYINCHLLQMLKNTP